MNLSFPIPVIDKVALSTHNCLSAMILRFPKPDSRDVLQPTRSRLSRLPLKRLLDICERTREFRRRTCAFRIDSTTCYDIQLENLANIINSLRFMEKVEDIRKQFNLSGSLPDSSKPL